MQFNQTNKNTGSVNTIISLNNCKVDKITIDGTDDFIWTDEDGSKWVRLETHKRILKETIEALGGTNA